jgi:hypothetical protein
LTIIGSRRGYYKLRQHYTILYQNEFEGIVGDFIRSTLIGSSLVDGISSASLHCIEDLGYALSVGYDQGTCDAIAYMHHSYSPIVVIKCYLSLLFYDIIFMLR